MTTAPTPDVLERLAERCETTSGPDRELDALIECAFECPCWLDGAGPPQLAEGWRWTFDAEEDGAVIVFLTLHNKTSKKHRKYSAPAYTASLDAAMTLVPPDFWWEIIQMFAPTSPMRNFGSRNGMFHARTAKRFGESGASGSHDKPALALTAACLRAKAALAQELGR